jgi:hypothetical protein
MRKFLALAFVVILLTTLSGSAYAQCWAINAGPDSSAKSDVRPSSSKPYEAVLLALEPELQKAMGVNSKVFMTEAGVVRSESSDGNVYFGVGFFNILTNKYGQVNKQLGFDVIPFGLKLIIAHEYAHQFQFRIFQKRKIEMSAPTPTTELQADIIGSYVLGSILDAQYSNLSQDKKVSRIYQESGGARMIVTELGDAFFNDVGHHGSPASRMNAIDQGFSAGMLNKYGPLSQALTAKEDELYDWSFKAADDIFKHQNMHVDRTF